MPNLYAYYLAVHEFALITNIDRITILLASRIPNIRPEFDIIAETLGNPNNFARQALFLSFVHNLIN